MTPLDEDNRRDRLDFYDEAMKAICDHMAKQAIEAEERTMELITRAGRVGSGWQGNKVNRFIAARSRRQGRPD